MSQRVSNHSPEPGSVGALEFSLRVHPQSCNGVDAASVELIGFYSGIAMFRTEPDPPDPVPRGIWAQ